MNCVWLQIPMAEVKKYSFEFHECTTFLAQKELRAKCQLNARTTPVKLLHFHKCQYYCISPGNGSIWYDNIWTRNIYIDIYSCLKLPWARGLYIVDKQMRVFILSFRTCSIVGGQIWSHNNKYIVCRIDIYTIQNINCLMQYWKLDMEHWLLPRSRTKCDEGVHDLMNICHLVFQISNSTSLVPGNCTTFKAKSIFSVYETPDIHYQLTAWPCRNQVDWH